MLVVSQTKALIFTQTLILRIPFSLFASTRFWVGTGRMFDQFVVKVDPSSFPCFKLNFVFAFVFGFVRKHRTNLIETK